MSNNTDYDEHFNTLDHQDWKTIVVHKPKTSDKVKNASKKPSNTTLKNASIEKKAESDDLHHKQLTLKLRQDIMKGRSAKSITQKQLANSINLPQQVISDIESGKAIYNANHINKIKRFLKLK
jgi:ribosome-binding protein aMBF1 (putative translation factor)